jgi:putative MATE family efflux protein
MSPSDTQARFVTGSILRHVVTMTLTGALGLMSMFLVDLADLFFLSLLKQTEVTAAIGYAGIISFANLSMSIGTGIAAAALVARNLGARRPERAREFATSTLLFTLLISAFLTILIAVSLDPILRFLGAGGEALHLAKIFVWTLTPGFILLSGAVNCSFTLRGLGDPRRAMFITLSVAIITAILDPIFIFALGWGIQGAAAANVVAYCFSLSIGLHGVARVHKFLLPFSLRALQRDYREISAIALPAILTQLAVPFSVAYLTKAVAPFGDEAIAASAIIGRVVPVAYGVIFSLAGSIGPIIGQNFGARNFSRVKQTLSDGLRFSSAYTIITSLLLFVFRHQLADVFHAAGRTSELVVFFCTFVAISWAFGGAQFVANAAFNNLGKPNLSTWFNWGKATLGTIPFAIFGGAHFGPEGIMAGTAIGSVLFGIASVVAAYRLVDRMQVPT